MKVAITGANGFVGQALSQHLLNQGHSVTALCRYNCESSTDSLTRIDYTNKEELKNVLQGHQAIVHLVGKTHSQDNINALNDYRATNVEFSKAIAESASAAGIRTFIYMSSIKAMGENCDQPYSIDTPPAPTTAYGISKREAEIELQDTCRENGMKLVVLRPPLIYSPTAKGNIQLLASVISKGFPLPVKSINNKRSLVELPDLCKIIASQLSPSKQFSVLLPCSKPAISTPQLAEKIAKDLSLKAKLLSIPTPALKLGLALIGKKEAYDKLCGNLEVTPNVTATTKTSETATL